MINEKSTGRLDLSHPDIGDLWRSQTLEKLKALATLSLNHCFTSVNRHLFG